MGYKRVAKTKGGSRAGIVFKYSTYNARQRLGQIETNWSN
jgi:hypothetical protein